MAEQIVAELILDDGKYSVKMKGASKEARAFKREVERLNSSMHRMEKSMRGPRGGDARLGNHHRPVSKRHAPAVVRDRAVDAVDHQDLS